jgi:hypothetical protein
LLLLLWLLFLLLSCLVVVVVVVFMLPTPFLSFSFFFCFFFFDSRAQVKTLDYNAHCCAKVADFGETRVLMVEKLRGHDAAHRRVANPTWLAPEVLLGM